MPDRRGHAVAGVARPVLLRLVLALPTWATAWPARSRHSSEDAPARAGPGDRPHGCSPACRIARRHAIRLYAVRTGGSSPFRSSSTRVAPTASSSVRGRRRTEFTFATTTSSSSWEGNRRPCPNDLLPRPADTALEFAVIDRARAGRRGRTSSTSGESSAAPPVRYATFRHARQEARALTYEVSYSQDRSNSCAASHPPGDGGEERRSSSVEDADQPRRSLSWENASTRRSPRRAPVTQTAEERTGARHPTRRQSADLGRMFPTSRRAGVHVLHATSFQTRRGSPFRGSR